MEHMTFLRDAVEGHRQRLEYLPFIEARLQSHPLTWGQKIFAPGFKVNFETESDITTGPRDSPGKEMMRLKMVIKVLNKKQIGESGNMVLGDCLMYEIQRIVNPREFEITSVMDIKLGCKTTSNKEILLEAIKKLPILSISFIGSCD